MSKKKKKEIPDQSIVTSLLYINQGCKATWISGIYESFIFKYFKFQFPKVKHVTLFLLF